MANAVLDTTTGTDYVKRWGETDFEPVSAGETQVTVNAGQSIPSAQPRQHFTVTAGNFVLLSASDQATADAAVEAERNANLQGTQAIARVFQNAADLPLPPPIARAIVAVVNGPGGLPGLAVSTPTFWVLFAADGQQGP